MVKRQVTTAYIEPMARLKIQSVKAIYPNSVRVIQITNEYTTAILGFGVSILFIKLSTSSLIKSFSQHLMHIKNIVVRLSILFIQLSTSSLLDHSNINSLYIFRNILVNTSLLGAETDSLVE